jgi:23S rRNA pseudouridine1911/1915/1917 synthase
MNRSNTSPSGNKGKTGQTNLMVNGPTELLKFLLASFPGKSRNSLKSLLGHKQICVNNKIITQFDFPLQTGQEVVVNRGKENVISGLSGLKIVFEDDHIIVIEKEAGLLSIATSSEKERTAYKMLSSHVKKNDPGNRIFVVHRLDQDTSGLMVFAKSEEVKSLLQEDWANTVMERTYLAVVEGHVEKEKGTITSWLHETKSLTMLSSQTPANGGQKAITHYHVIKNNQYYSLLEVNLDTGRKNQIRVHMQDIGHHIVGDKKYGALVNPIHRLGLHAQALAFRHPITGEELRFKTSVPPSFLKLFR